MTTGNAKIHTSEGGTNYIVLAHPEPEKVYLIIARLRGGYSLGSDVEETEWTNLKQYGVPFTQADYEALNYATTEAVAGRITQLIQTPGTDPETAEVLEDLHRSIAGFKGIIYVELQRRVSDGAARIILRDKPDGFLYEWVGWDATEGHKGDVAEQDVFPLADDYPNSMKLAKAVVALYEAKDYKVEFSVNKYS